MENLTVCPVCRSEHSLRPAVTVPDHSLTGEIFTLQRCDACSVLLTNPRPKGSEISRYYDFPEYISHRDDAPGLLNWLYQQARKWTTRQKIALLNRVAAKSSERKLLDYGCGTGYFLHAAQHNGWNVMGIEVDNLARNAASERLAQPILSSVDELPEGAFSVITLWHVLEHIHELDRTLEKLLYHLQPDGTLIVAVPNPQAADAVLYGDWWAAYDVPRHLYHFSPKSIRALMSRHGAYVAEQLPQILDSIYISLLSEKYRKGNPLTGVLNGIRSNWKARQNGMYSSLIYLIKKTSDETSRSIGSK
jgi:2-polyprenyl-3-methyl-5-hydroxy-6-metoxy-1,4-benzoquinol methylase